MMEESKVAMWHDVLDGAVLLAVARFDFDRNVHLLEGRKIRLLTLDDFVLCFSGWNGWFSDSVMMEWNTLERFHITLLCLCITQSFDHRLLIVSQITLKKMVG